MFLDAERPDVFEDTRSFRVVDREGQRVNGVSGGDAELSEYVTHRQGGEHEQPKRGEYSGDPAHIKIAQADLVDEQEMRHQAAAQDEKELDAKAPERKKQRAAVVAEQ